jgi:hypothetical protein
MYADSRADRLARMIRRVLRLPWRLARHLRGTAYGDI